MSVIVGTSLPGAANMFRKKTGEPIQAVVVVHDDYDNPHKSSGSCYVLCVNPSIAEKIKDAVSGATDAVSCCGFPCLYMEISVSDAYQVISKLL